MMYILHQYVQRGQDSHQVVSQRDGSSHLFTRGEKVERGRTKRLNKSRGRKTFNLILGGQHYSDTKISQGYHKKRKLQANIPGKHRCKNPQQNIHKLNSTIYKRIIYHNQIKFIPEVQGWFNTQKSINVTYYINKMQDKNYINILTDAEKTLIKFNI